MGLAVVGLPSVDLAHLLSDDIEFPVKGLRPEGYPDPEPTSEALLFTVPDSGYVSGEAAVGTLCDITTFANRMGVSHRQCASTSTVAISGARWVVAGFSPSGTSPACPPGPERRGAGNRRRFRRVCPHARVREGMPHQTLLGSVIQKYVMGSLVDMNEVRKVLTIRD
jgi:hypothetical protein